MIKNKLKDSIKTERTDNSNLNEFTRQLQEQIFNQLKKQYSDIVLDYWQHPRNYKSLKNPDGYAKEKGSCGDSMEMFIRMKKDIIVECSFLTDGCGTTIACGSTATEMAKGKSFTEALALISAQEIIKHLQGLPEADTHCAYLAAETLRRALADYLHQKKAPWKKHYRRP